MESSRPAITRDAVGPLRRLILGPGRVLPPDRHPIFRYAVPLGILALIGLAVANPDGVIAERNLRHSNQPIDLAYLRNLSPDAVPALMKLPDEQRACVLRAISDDLRPGDWRTWNLGSARARSLINGQVGSGQGWC